MLAGLGKGSLLQMFNGSSRLIQSFADDIRQMYLPGPSLPGVRKAEFGISDLIG
jgi:hypothetical protein